MSQPPPKAGFEKGDRAAVVGGRSGLGVRGEVFWVGENKYGPGMRYGLRGDDGKTYWLDETDIGSEADAPEPPPQPETPAGGPSFERGDRVTIIDAPKGVGVSGNVFWVGESRYSNQMRYGVKGDDEETYWVDHNQVTAENGDGPAPQSGGGGPERANKEDVGSGAVRSAPTAPALNTPPEEDASPAGPRPFDEAPPNDNDLPPEAFMDEQPNDDFGDMPDDDLPF